MSEAQGTGDGGDPPLRLTEAGFAASLALFETSPLVGAGKVTILALDAIADRLGPRWSVRRELVHDHVDKVLARELGPSAVVRRISDTEFIVAQPDATRLSGQMHCLNCLREILHHFIGQAAAVDIRVHEVTRITDAEIYGQRLDFDTVERSRDAERTGERLGYPAEEPARATLDRWTPFVTSTGRRVGVSCDIEPVFKLKDSARIGSRISRSVVHLPSGVALSQPELEALSSSDIERIDFATIARGIDAVRLAAANGKPLCLIVPVTHTTLLNARGRAVAVALFRQARTEVRHGLVGEISGIGGLPSASIVAATSTIRPFCLHVIGCLGDNAARDVRRLLDSRLDGFSISCPPLEGDAAFVGWARGVAGPLRRARRALILYRVPSPRRARLAAVLGVTHATLDA